MLPIYLSIEGLYSYQHKQEIDFTTLTEGGLFGIFGAVGSGKSSILEAISYVLYGDTERLNSKEKRNYNMLNLKSKQARIVFDFLNFENQKFRFTAEWKRNTKRFEETTGLTRKAYKWSEGEWIPLESADGALVTNLSYPNFRRTIIIPQGKFKEFLELGGKDRSIMMKEIFQLQRFDLGPKTSSLLQDANRKAEHLRGALSGYETVSSELLMEKERWLVEEKATLNQLKVQRSTQQLHYDKLKQANERHKTLSEKQEKLAALIAQKTNIEQQEKSVQRYEQAVALFKDPLAQAQKLNSEKELLTRKVENLTSERKTLSKDVEHVENTFLTIQAAYVKLDTLRGTAEDYRYLIDIKQHEGDLIRDTKSLEKGKKMIAEEKSEENGLRAELAQTEAQVDRLKEKEFDTRQLLDMESWYLRNQSITELTTLNTQKIAGVKDEIRQIEQQMVTLGFEPTGWQDLLNDKIEHTEQQLHELKHQQTHLQVQVRLGEFAQELTPGAICPLCGALEHPNPMNAAEATADLSNNKAQIDKATHQLKEWQDTGKQLQQLASNRTHKIAELEKLKEEQIGIKQQHDAHQKRFLWSAYAPDDKSLFDQQKALIQQHAEQTKAAERLVKTLRIRLEEKTQTVRKYEARLQDLLAQVTILETKIGQSKKQLVRLEANEYTGHTTDQLVTLRKETLDKIQYIQDRYQLIGTQLNERRQEFANVSGQLNVSLERFGVVREEAAEKQQYIATLLSEHGYEDQMRVQQIIAQNLPAQQIRAEITQFFVQLQVLEEQVKELQKETAQDTFSPEELRQAERLLHETQQSLEVQIGRTGGLEKELAQLSLEYHKKEKLLEEYSVIESRINNLRTLENLFKGNGFVNYVSTIHMERLCEMANQRFRRLTKNQLSLTINENNEFEVVDYLNNGYKRSVKTLSGGQAFQASLCLALALAENIQTRHKAEKHFFFIDEGFGTQDNESINTVFDTLQYLHHENRIVGIISHVDELKERMPRSVTVVKDLEKGSVVTVS